MDNKITKKRFADFLSYEWIVITVVILVAILAWEVVFTLFAVKPTDGQRFKILYDQEVDYEYEKDIVVVTHDEARAFSYDVLEIGKEGLTYGIENEIGIRYQTRDCDVIVATSNKKKDDAGNEYARADYITEGFNPWSYEKAVADGDRYLEGLLKSSVQKFKAGEISQYYTYSQIDESKVDELFLTRQKRDNRFRTKAQKEEGKTYERLRIQKICEEVAFAKRLLRDYSGEDGIFYTYTLGQQAYDQAVKSGVDSNISSAKKTLDQNKQTNLDNYRKEALSYGIRVDKLKDGKYRPAQFFTTYGKCENLVLLAFDFISDQPHLQFESLSFMNSIVRMCSNII